MTSRRWDMSKTKLMITKVILNTDPSSGSYVAIFILLEVLIQFNLINHSMVYIVIMKERLKLWNWTPWTNMPRIKLSQSHCETTQKPF